MSDTPQVLDEILYTLRDIKESLDAVAAADRVFSVTIVNDQEHFETRLDDIRSR